MNDKTELDKEIQECETLEVLSKLLLENEIDGNSESLNGKSVFIVYMDGEINYTKAGDIYLQRTLHLFNKPIDECEEILPNFTDKISGYPCVVLDSNIVDNDALHIKIKELYSIK